jgi:predicted nucleic acid-binding protein
VKYLADANVLSEPTKPRPAPQVVDWLRDNESLIVVNPIILGELQYGVLVLPPGRRRTHLEQWLDAGIRKLRVLDMDGQTASIWAELLADLKRKGRAMSVKDSLLAATARQHGLTVASRNVGDFRFAGVALIDPFSP